MIIKLWFGETHREFKWLCRRHIGYWVFWVFGVFLNFSKKFSQMFPPLSLLFLSKVSISVNPGLGTKIGGSKSRLENNWPHRGGCGDGREWLPVRVCQRRRVFALVTFCHIVMFLWFFCGYLVALIDFNQLPLNNFFFRSYFSLSFT